MAKSVRTIVIHEWDDEILEDDYDDEGYEDNDNTSNLMYAFQENVHFGF